MAKQEVTIVKDTLRSISVEQREAQKVEKQLKSPTLMMLVLIAVLGSLLYGSFLFNPANRGDFLPYAFVIIAESFLLSQALLSLWTILASGYDPRTFEFHRAQDKLFITKLQAANGKQKVRRVLIPTMRLRHKAIVADVFVTTYGEDLDIIRKTVLAAQRSAAVIPRRFWMTGNQTVLWLWLPNLMWAIFAAQIIRVPKPATSIMLSSTQPASYS